MHTCLHKKRHAKIFVVILTLLFYFCYIKKIQSIVFWNDDRLITIVITQGLLIFFWCYFALASFLYRHTLSNKSVSDFYHHSVFSNVPTFLFLNGRLVEAPPPSLYFLKSPVLRWLWLECQIFMTLLSVTIFTMSNRSMSIKALIISVQAKEAPGTNLRITTVCNF